MAYDVFQLNSTSAKNILSRLKKQGNLNLLVGSAISLWSPSSIPTGQAFTYNIAELLVKQFDIKDKDGENELIKAIIKTPFEYIWEQCPISHGISDLIADQFVRSNPSNGVHEAIGQLCQKGIFGNILTTNYDCGLDDLLLKRKDINRIIFKSDLKNINRRKKIYFKIHGTAEIGLRSSLVYKLSQEGVMKRWKSNIIKKCVKGKTLLIIGYSGLDFEICPELVRDNFEPKEVIWLKRRHPDEKELTPYSNHVLNKVNNSVVLVGDLVDCLNKLGASIPHLGEIVAEPTWDIEGEIGVDNLQLWACSILSPPGYVRYTKLLAEKVLKRATRGSRLRANAKFLLGDAKFSEGKYIHSEKLCKEASIEFLKQRDYDLYSESVARQSEALRCAGRFEDSSKVLSQARDVLHNDKSLNSELFMHRLDIKEALLHRSIYQFLSWRGDDKEAEHHRGVAKEMLISIIVFAHNNGIWHDLVQSKMWAKRLGYEFSELYKNSDTVPLDEWFGFRHLGHIIQQMMSARDSLWREVSTEKASKEELQYFIKESKKMGILGEQWKLALAYNQHYGKKFDLRWLLPFLRCNYTPRMRQFLYADESHR